jgi:hypothetical protein
MRGFFSEDDIIMNGGIYPVSGLSSDANDADWKGRTQAILPKAKVVVIYHYDRDTQSIDLLKRWCEASCKGYRQYQRLWRLKDKKRHTESIIVGRQCR